MPAARGRGIPEGKDSSMLKTRKEHNLRVTGIPSAILQYLQSLDPGWGCCSAWKSKEDFLPVSMS